MVARYISTLLVLATIAPAWAQDKTSIVVNTTPETIASTIQKREDAILEHQNVLNTLLQQQATSASRLGVLDTEITGLQSDRAGLRLNLITLARTIDELDEDIAIRETRLATLFEDEVDTRGRLHDQRYTLGRIVGALQRIGKNPPPALVVKPRDALAAVRSAIILGAIMPNLRSKAAALAKDLNGLITIRRRIGDESTLLSERVAKLNDDRSRMNLLLETKRNQEQIVLASRTNQAKQLEIIVTRSTSLNELIRTLEKDLDIVQRKELERKQQEQLARTPLTQEEKLTAMKDMSRMAPAIPFDKTRGLLPKPVRGVQLASFQRNTKDRGRFASGIRIATRNGAQVTSPCDGWIVYAGDFRSYGKLLIIDAGNDYHVVLTGMETLNVTQKQFVLTGEPVGNMRTTRVASVSALNPDTIRPVLYVEFRKGGVAIDPAPWWIEPTEVRNQT
ncbi:MAG: peptidoglycan DD-metalloendopeptidase family protein [Cohaesibacteraceae bacterium]|nr:peptidoglycan DD-metalloendopeptidase family protein [Cohaesibacteraceae bacterium]